MAFLNHLQRCAAYLRKATTTTTSPQENHSGSQPVQYRQSSETNSARMDIKRSPMPEETVSVQLRKTSEGKSTKKDAWGSPLPQKPFPERNSSSSPISTKPIKTDGWGCPLPSNPISGRSSSATSFGSIRQETSLDFHNHLHAISPDHLSRKPNPALVDKFGRMYTYALLREAKDPNKPFCIERFMELHRRATEFWMKKDRKARENWDTVFISPMAESRNARFLKEYDEKWKVAKFNGCSVCL